MGLLGSVMERRQRRERGSGQGLHLDQRTNSTSAANLAPLRLLHTVQGQKSGMFVSKQNNF